MGVYGDITRYSGGGILHGVSEMGNEIATRCSKHVLIGMERDPRYASRQWRAIINNCEKDNMPFQVFMQSMNRQWGNTARPVRQLQDKLPPYISIKKRCGRAPGRKKTGSRRLKVTSIVTERLLVCRKEMDLK